MHHLRIFIQNAQIPAQLPKKVPSSPDNVDMERLKKDIPKFLNNSRVISTEKKEWWADFFARSEQTYSAETNGDSQTWLLDDLKKVKFADLTISSGQSDADDDADGISNANVERETPVNVPQEVTEMVNGQYEDIPQVNIGKTHIF